MSIPDYQTLMLPLLKLAADGEMHRFSDAVETLALQFELSEDERKHMLPSGTQRTLPNRVGWARTYMKKAGLLTDPKRGFFQITDRGKQVLQDDQDSIDVKFLRQFDEFLEFQTKRNKPTEVVGVSDDRASEDTPEETLESAYERLRVQLANELIERVLEMTPESFEDLVVKLLVAMGYGGSRKEAGTRIGKSGDGGIDGIINEDRLGLDVIYIQAKRWQGTVGRPEIQKFVGALQGVRAKKGVFITSSTYSKDAIDYSSNLDSKVILIDGDELASFMIDFNVGVSLSETYQVKRIDMDFFSED